MTRCATLMETPLTQVSARALDSWLGVRTNVCGTRLTDQPGRWPMDISTVN